MIQTSWARRTILITLTAALLVVAVFTAVPRGGKAVQESDPEIQASLNAINMYRRWLGLPPMTIHPALQQAAENHANYYRLNYGDPHLAGMGLHMEVEGNPGFTGADMSDRASAAGYDSPYVNENAGISGSMFWSTDWFIGTVGHRLTLIDPRYTDVGMAFVDEGEMVFEVIQLGSPDWENTSGQEWVAWPPANATGVGLDFWGEAPDPFAAEYPVGYPITLSWHGEGEIVLERFSLTTNGLEVPSFAAVGDGWLTHNTAMLVSVDPLQSSTTYTVSLAGMAGGQPFEKTWSFTTTSGEDPIALNGEFAPGPDQFSVPPAGTSPTPSAPVSTTPATLPTVTIPGDAQLPPGIEEADADVQALWLGSDGPVWTESVDRSWLYGPDTWERMEEPYAEDTGDQRSVYYFDKARIEVNEPESGLARNLTAGLLVRDMLAGLVQVGDDDFQEGDPARVAIAGDRVEDNPGAPTYASFGLVASLDGPANVPPRQGESILEVLNSRGEVGTSPSLEGIARYGSYEPTLGHNIAAVFDGYLASLAVDWRQSVGLPLTEPYWVRTRVAGVERWVLVQAFERRVLTFTPTNPVEWQLEMGNVGRHYYEWRYQREAPELP
jgi:uncharacterized protein YkwD